MQMPSSTDLKIRAIFIIKQSGDVIQKLPTEYGRNGGSVSVKLYIDGGDTGATLSIYAYCQSSDRLPTLVDSRANQVIQRVP